MQNEAVKSLIHKSIDQINFGKLDEARISLTALAELSPEHPDIHHLLAVVEIRTEQELELAQVHAIRAIELMPEQPVYQNTLGSVLWKLGQFAEAKAMFQKVLDNRPDYPEAQYNLGNCFKSLGDNTQALKHYDLCLQLDPGFSDAHNEIGLIHQARKSYSEAAASIKAAIASSPSRYEFHANLAGLEQERGNYDAALVSIRSALSLSPDNGELINNMGTIFLDQDNHIEAAACFQSALQMLPDSIGPLFNLGYTNYLEKNYEQALHKFETVLAKSEYWIAAKFNKGNCLFMLNRYEECIACHKDLLKHDVSTELICRNIGAAYRRLNDSKTALSYFKKAVEHAPDHASAHVGVAMSYFKLGEIEKGWRHYEWRFQGNNSHLGLSTDLNKPFWNGSDLQGKTLLVANEQGVGDTLHFIRYVQLVRDHNCRIIFRTGAKVQRLVDRLDYIDESFLASEDCPDDYDYFVPLLSIPRIYNTRLETIPWRGPYIRTDPDNVKRWSGRLAKDKFKIGIVWHGNPDQPEDRFRSCSLADFAPLMDQKDVHFYSLQIAPTEEEKEVMQQSCNITDLEDDLLDFAETADVMASLDLVITIDTSVAHLAGALGKPVWVVLWFAHCWRYLEARTDSPWYPSMRLFRQPSIGDWASVFSEVRTALQAHPRI